MDIKQINELREEFNKRLDVIVNDIENQQKEPQGLGCPKLGDRIFWIDSFGDISKDKFAINHDERAFFQGNILRTKEDAERVVKRRIVTQKLRVLAGGFKPDWKDEKQLKEHVCLNPKSNTLATAHYAWKSQGVIYFPEGKAKHAIDTLGDELLCLFDVEAE